MSSTITMEVGLAHVAVGANASSNALSANRALSQGMTCDASVACAAFAAKNSVALVTRDRTTPSLLTVRSLLQHRGATRDATRITTVFLHAPPSASLNDHRTSRVLAGDSEGNVLLWTMKDSQEDTEWNLQSLHGVDGDKISNDPVSAVTAVRTQRRWLYVAAFSSGHVAVWQQLHNEADRSVHCVAVTALGVRMIMETLAATAWTNESNDEAEEDDVLLAAGGVDSKVYLFEVAGGTESLTQLIGLEGHRGWIRAVDFETRPAQESDSLLLVSASQDHRVRLWKISSVALAAASDASATASSAGFQACGLRTLYTISFDALLIAHEDWVTSLGWTRLPADTDATDSQPALVSTSMDNTVIVWQKSANVGASSGGAWVPTLRVGEHGGNGVLTSVVLPASDVDNDARLDLLALNLSGQLERWRQEPSPSKTFLPAPSLTGHTSPVTDLSWSPRGDYFISCSLDQTTRVLAPLRSNDSWHEISRAQVHGYDLNCGAFLKGTSPGSNDRFVSGADEKILRVFEAPDDLQVLVQAMQNGEAENSTTVEPSPESSNTTPTVRVEHAYLPELSLTNKSTDKNTEKKTPSLGVGAYAMLGETTSIRLPVGDTLAKKTLWPERRKLYGHGNELLCVASNHAGTLVVSACKSREEKFASVWLWHTSDWSAAGTAGPLDGHKSSVVQLAFSPNDRFLLSVSKDRQFCVFTKGQEDEAYRLTDRVKAHKRIIWSCAWAPDSLLFATGARDQTVALWGRSGDGKWCQQGESIPMESAVTAVAFAPWFKGDDGEQQMYLLAVGLETGAIHFYTVTTSATANNILLVARSIALTIPIERTPTAAITRLAWSPSASDLVLACASADHSVRLYRVQLP